MPPGPPRLPLIGNLLNAPTENPFLKWHAWSYEYGPIISLNVLGTTIVILNDTETATELLSSRAPSYSGRPPSAMGVLITKDKREPLHMLLRGYDATFRLHQRLLTGCMNVTSERRFRALQALETLQLLHDLLADIGSDGTVKSDRVYAHLERAQASLTMGLSYGYRIPEPDHAITRDTLRVHGELTELVTATTLIDVFPEALWRLLPASLSPWHRTGSAHYAREAELHARNYVEAMANPGWNFVKKMRASVGASDMSDFMVGYLAGANTVAGLETSSRALLWLFVATLTAPSLGTGSGRGGFVRRAQAALDRVVGRSRLPDMSDRLSLPYIDAVLMELLRWRPVAASGVPHRADKADEYRGFRIPEGAIVISNIWAIGREEKVFGERVDEFIPERWLRSQSGAAEVDWADASIRRDMPKPFFGYGRRMCTGRYMAEDGLWIAIAQLLWAFDFENVGEGTAPNVNDMRPHGFTITPGPFELRLQPRGTWVAELVSQEWSVAAKDISEVLGEMPEKSALGSY
ncbi:putative cytochrome P450 [Xylariales sp. PMI_506]|nr:putative cytochrome P450 [Xylariales sp. PMI_506]